MIQPSAQRIGHTLFEFPLNERFRTYLRLEALYTRWAYYLSQPNKHDHHSALLTLFEINEFAFRYDLKGDLLLEINRYKQSLNRLRQMPDVSAQKLEQTILQLIDAQKQIEQSSKFGSTLSDNEWLLNSKTRIVVPGGVCSFDVAFYYQWQQQPESVRRTDLESWILPLNPLFEALKLILVLVRDATRHKTCISSGKTYQLPLNNMRFDLLQVELSSESPYLPDISANKHVVWLRFALPNYRNQPKHLRIDPSETEVEFELNLCGMQ